MLYDYISVVKELLDLPVGKDGTEHTELYEILEKVLEYSVHTGRPITRTCS